MESMPIPVIGLPKKKLSAKQKLVAKIIKQQNDIESEIEALRKRNKRGAKTSFVTNKYIWKTRNIKGTLETKLLQREVACLYKKTMHVKIYCALLNNII